MMKNLTRIEFESLKDKRGYSEKAYVEVCRIMDENARDFGLYRCSGCLGRHIKNYYEGIGPYCPNRLDHHHIWRRSDAPLWYHFQSENLVLLCRVCHERIDGTEEQQRSLICYHEINETIKRLKLENQEWIKNYQAV